DPIVHQEEGAPGPRLGGERGGPLPQVAAGEPRRAEVEGETGTPGRQDPPSELREARVRQQLVVRDGVEARHRGSARRGTGARVGPRAAARLRRRPGARAHSKRCPTATPRPFTQAAALMRRAPGGWTSRKSTAPSPARTTIPLSALAPITSPAWPGGRAGGPPFPWAGGPAGARPASTPRPRDAAPAPPSAPSTRRSRSESGAGRKSFTGLPAAIVQAPGTASMARTCREISAAVRIQSIRAIARSIFGA